MAHRTYIISRVKDDQFAVDDMGVGTGLGPFDLGKEHTLDDIMEWLATFNSDTVLLAAWRTQLETTGVLALADDRPDKHIAHITPHGEHDPLP